LKNKKSQKKGLVEWLKVGPEIKPSTVKKRKEKGEGM
jgi:hypothetical protein